jgi:hypothetical protein
LDLGRLATLIYATVHGAVDLALAGQVEESKDLEDPIFAASSAPLPSRDQG